MILRVVGLAIRTAVTAFVVGVVVCTLALIRWPERSTAILLDALQTLSAPPGPMPEAAGVIVLGGGIHAFVHDKGAGAGQRIVVALDLLRANPRYALVATGGGEAAQLPAIVAAQGLTPEIRVVADARDTYEEARDTAAILGERKHDSWILVTSAWHMPRAIAAFRGQGVNVVALAVDVMKAGDVHARETVTKEYLGLLYYLLSGRIGPWPVLRNIVTGPV